MNVSHQQGKKSATFLEVETVTMDFQTIQQQNSPLVLAALSIRSTTEENLAYSKKNPL